MNRILIIHRGALGDFLFLAPALALLRQMVPHWKREALAHPEFARALMPDLLDAATSVESSLFLPVFEDLGEIPKQMADFFAGFEAVLAFVNDPAHVLEQNLARLGVSRVLVRPPFPPEGERAHAARYLFRQVWDCFRCVAGIEGIQAQSFDFQPAALRFSNSEIQRANLFLGPAAAARAPIALHPGSGSPRKCWPAERFEELARALVKKGSSIFWILGPADTRLAPRVRALAQELAALVAESLPLRDLAALISLCSAYAGNDSGITHLAALSGIPVFSIFGPTAPAVWGPTGRHAHIVSSNTHCSPCTRQKMHACEQRICLDSVPVQAVLDELKV